MPDVDKELDKKEDEELDLEDQEQEDLQDDAENQDEDQQDDEQEEADDQGDDDSDDEEEGEKPKVSRREQLRIQQLLAKMKEDEPSPEKPRKAKEETVFDDQDEDPDVAAKYQKDLDSVYRFSKFETRLEVDAPRVEAKYSQLDKGSEDFNPVLADTINRMYLSFVGFDPKNRSVRTADIRYADYVESVYELASEIAGETVERTTTNLRKQASKTGVRPGGGTPKRLNLNKAPSEMTDEELEAVIAQGIPPKK